MLPKGLSKEYSRAISNLVRTVDMFMILLAGCFAYFLRFGNLHIPVSYWGCIAIGTFLIAIIFSWLNIYASLRGQQFFRHMLTLLQGISLLSITLASLAFLTKSGETFSRIWFFLWMSNALGLVVLFRCSLLVFLRFMRSQGLNERRVVIFGAGELGTKLAGTIQQALWTGFRIIAFLDDHADAKANMLYQIPVLQTPADLSAYLTQHEIDEIWLALPLRSEARVKTILYELRHHTIHTRFVLDIFGLDLLNHSMTDVAGFPVLNIRSTPMRGMNRVVKAIEDRIIAGIILLLISPLCLLIALLVKSTSKGAIFFKQRRLGWDGRVIKVYKFRTMYEHKEKEGIVTQATMGDKRITPIGKILRRTSLDELPQFINVLQGRMSIVGPRPHALAHNELYKKSIDTYMQRHHVKPGITGWAQVNGWRGETDTLNKMQKRVEYDLYYINNWSLSFDLKIILLTLFKGFSNPNAY